MLLRIESCDAPRPPPAPQRTARPGRGGSRRSRRTRRSPLGSASSDNGRADRPQRPAVRPEDAEPARAAGADRTGAPHVRAAGSTRPWTRPGWDAGSGPRPTARRSGPRPTGSGRHPGTPGGRFREAVACRQEQAGRRSARCRAPAGPLAAAADGAGAGGPGAPCSRPPAGSCSSWPSPATTSSALAVLGPAALALAVHGQRFRSGLWLGLVFGLAFFVPLLSWTGIYVGPFPWLALAVFEALHLALLGGATALTSRLRLLAAVDGGALGGRRGAARAVRPRRLPLGPAGLQPDRGPAARRWPPTAACRWSASPSPSPARCWPRRSLALAGPGGPPATAGGAAARRSGRGARRGRRAGRAAGRRARLAAAARRRRSPRAARPRTVAVIQGNVPRAGLDFNAQRRAVLDNHVQRTLELAAARRGGGGAAAGRRHLAGEQLRHRPVPQRRRRPADRPGRPGDRRADPGRRGRRGPGASSSATPRSSGTPTTGPGDTYVKRHPVPARRVRAGPRRSSGSSATRSTWCAGTSSPATRSACWTSAAPGSATSSASRWSTTAWCTTSSTAAPG